jgi:membrane protein implicated in regulation of membrane protease activity
MIYVFAICAAVGGAVLLVQFALTLFGMSGDWASDIPDDLPDSPDADLGVDAEFGSADTTVESGNHSAAWFFNVLTLRSLVAALAIFGFAGLAADAAEMRPISQWVIAIASGVAALYAVAWLLGSMRKLGADGTLRIRKAVGGTATVYVPIAPRQSRPGKVQMKLQDRLVELEAVTSGDERLETGRRVRVIGLVGSRLHVEPLHEAVAP